LGFAAGIVAILNVSVNDASDNCLSFSNSITASADKQDHPISDNTHPFNFESTDKPDSFAAPKPLKSTDATNIDHCVNLSTLKLTDVKKNAEHFNCFKIGNATITSIAYNAENNTLITGSSSGEICVCNHKGVVLKRKDDSSIEILEFKLISRSCNFFPNLTSNENPKNDRLFSVFKKVIEDDAFAKHEMIVLNDRFKKIHKRKLQPVNLFDFLSCSIIRTDNGNKQTNELNFNDLKSKMKT
jgi:hypothetical protein